jgi:H+/Cl- antiporter ClcA
MEAVALGHVQLSMRATASRVASSWAAIAGGMSIGREGPLIEFGGALGAAVGRVTATSLNRTRVLVAAGTAAGFAAAYNTPFAATLFVLETIAGVVAPELILPVIGGTVAATLITRAVVGVGPIYGQRAFGLESGLDVLSSVALGVVAAVSAMTFKRVLALLEGWAEDHPGAATISSHDGWLAGRRDRRVAPVGRRQRVRASESHFGWSNRGERVGDPARRQTDCDERLGRLGRSRRHLYAHVADGRAALGSEWSHLFGPAGAFAPDAGRYALIRMAATTAASTPRSPLP